jgi:hypothetical protein
MLRDDAIVVAAGGLGHVLKLRVLRELAAGEASPSELSERLGEKLGNAEGRVVEDRNVALNLLEEIVVEADMAMTRLATGEALRGTAALKRIRDLARDALRLSRDTPAS